jgi:hypothetical protein
MHPGQRLLAYDRPVDGAQALMASLVGAGVDVCFMNPGRSEMHFFSALDSVPAMRGVLALFPARAYAEPGPHLIEAMVPPVVPAAGTAW